jgi:hypothetical protein
MAMTYIYHFALVLQSFANTSTESSFVSMAIRIERRRKKDNMDEQKEKRTKTRKRSKCRRGSRRRVKKEG